jgi:hypothetical protein
MRSEQRFDHRLLMVAWERFRDRILDASLSLSAALRGHYTA